MSLMETGWTELIIELSNTDWLDHLFGYTVSPTTQMYKSIDSNKLHDSVSS